MVYYGDSADRADFPDAGVENDKIRYLFYEDGIEKFCVVFQIAKCVLFMIKSFKESTHDRVVASRVYNTDNRNT